MQEIQLGPIQVTHDSVYPTEFDSYSHVRAVVIDDDPLFIATLDNNLSKLFGGATTINKLQVQPPFSDSEIEQTFSQVHSMVASSDSKSTITIVFIDQFNDQSNLNLSVGTQLSALAAKLIQHDVYIVELSSLAHARVYPSSIVALSKSDFSDICLLLERVPNELSDRLKHFFSLLNHDERAAQKMSHFDTQMIDIPKYWEQFLNHPMHATLVALIGSTDQILEIDFNSMTPTNQLEFLHNAFSILGALASLGVDRVVQQSTSLARLRLLLDSDNED